MTGYPLELHEIVNHEGRKYSMRAYVPDGSVLAPIRMVWCGSCIHQCWLKGAGGAAPFRDNTTVTGLADYLETCSRCLALKGGR